MRRTYFAAVAKVLEGLPPILNALFKFGGRHIKMQLTTIPKFKAMRGSAL